MTYQLHTHDAPAIAEDPRAQARRRIQHKRCLVCGARQLAGGHNTSYFCARHITTHRWCPLCEWLRTAEEHGKDSRCRGCSARKALAQYHADPGRTLYRLKLRQLARRQSNRCDEIFSAIRRRIALAAFVAATPGWTWAQRAQTLGMNVTHIAQTYRNQCAGRVRDPDAAERERR
jgi:hypothetical protein